MVKKPTLKYKKVKGRITTLKAIPYKGHMVYLRRIDIEIFEYLVVIRKQVFSAYWIIKPGKGKKDLTKDQVNQAAALVMAGACTTVDYQLGVELDPKMKKIVDTFEKSAKRVVN